MKTFLSFLYLLVFSAGRVEAQSDSLKLKIVKGDYIYTYRGDPLSERQLYERLRTNAKAWGQIRDKKVENIFAGIFGYAGVALLGYSLGTFIIEDKAKTLPLYFGILSTGLSLPFVFDKKRRIRQAVRIYNISVSP